MANDEKITLRNSVVSDLELFFEGDAEITYWIDKKFWGKGVATTALKTFLDAEKKTCFRTCCLR